MNFDVEKALELIGQGKTDRYIARILGLPHHEHVGNLRKAHGLLPNTRTPLTIYLSSEETIVCSRCLLPRPEEMFQYGRRGRKYVYRYTFCNSCRNDYARVRKSNDVYAYLTAALSRTVRRARKLGLPATILASEVHKLWDTQKGLCFYTDLIMTHQLGEGLQRTNVSFDKIIPELGYVSGNVVLCQTRINSMKGDASLEEMETWMPEWYTRIRMWRYELGLPVIDVGNGVEF